MENYDFEFWIKIEFSSHQNLYSYHKIYGDYIPLLSEVDEL